MTLRLAVMWIVLAAVLGFVLGGTIVDWSLERPPYQKHDAARDNQQATNTVNDRSAFFAIGAWANDNAAAIGALSAIGVLLFTVILAVSTIVLWDATRGLQRSGERQFLAANRPRITVRFVQGPITYTESGRVGAAVTIANIGPSDATIIAIGCDIGIRRGNRWASNIDGIPKPIPPIVLRSGQRHTVEVEAREGDGDDNFYFAWGFMRAESEGSRTGPPDQAVAVAGEIVYRDGNGIERHTGFLRTYDSESDRWVLDKDPGNEHED